MPGARVVDQQVDAAPVGKDRGERAQRILLDESGAALVERPMQV
jgi:hypothetical protein